MLGSLRDLADALKYATSPSLIINNLTVASWDRDFKGAYYWRMRCSLNFRPELIKIAEDYIAKTFGAQAYLAVHLRRGDFLQAHANEVPTLDDVARQIKALKAASGLSRCFIATDAKADEIEYLRQFIDFDVFRGMVPGPAAGGKIAIVDQIIASRGRFFADTKDSFFSHVIEQERDIMGIPGAQTYNYLCPRGHAIANATAANSPAPWSCTRPIPAELPACRPHG